MRLTHEERQVFRMLASARRPSGRQGEMGPLLLSDRARKPRYPTRWYRRRRVRPAQVAREGAEGPDRQGVRRRTLAVEVAKRASLVQEVELRRPGSQVCDIRLDGQAGAWRARVGYLPAAVGAAASFGLRGLIQSVEGPLLSRWD
jgi:hypothetical protein